jgi:hypothetical protein
MAPVSTSKWTFAPDHSVFHQSFYSAFKTYPFFLPFVYSSPQVATGDFSWKIIADGTFVHDTARWYTFLCLNCLSVSDTKILSDIFNILGRA